MADTKNTILHGRIFPPLIRFAIPLMLAILLQALYGAVDLFVVGKFGDTASVSAVSNGSQIMHTITGIITGLTMGVTVLVGHAVGAKDNDRAARTVGGAIRLFALVTVVITTMMVIFTKEIAVFMNVPAEAMDKTVEYVRICSAGTVFIVGFNAISGLFRGLGNSKSPLLFIGIACAVNIAADLLLVGYFKLDAAGAAYATIFAAGSQRCVFNLQNPARQAALSLLQRAYRASGGRSAPHPRNGRTSRPSGLPGQHLFPYHSRNNQRIRSCCLGESRHRGKAFPVSRHRANVIYVGAFRLCRAECRRASGAPCA